MCVGTLRTRNPARQGLFVRVRFTSRSGGEQQIVRKKEFNSGLLRKSAAPAVWAADFLCNICSWHPDSIERVRALRIEDYHRVSFGTEASGIACLRTGRVFSKQLVASINGACAATHAHERAHMIRTIAAAAFLAGATAIGAQAAPLASPDAMSQSTLQQVLLKQVKNERRGDGNFKRHRNRRWHHSDRRWRDGDRHWRRSYGRHYRYRYGYRPWNWQPRGCWRAGPAWFCP